MKPHNTPPLSIRELVYQLASDYMRLHDHNDQQKSALYTLMIEQAEAGLIQAALEFTEGNVSSSARIMGISRNTLLKKLKHTQMSHTKNDF